MKKVFSALLITISFLACKKEDSGTPKDNHTKSLYEVYLIGKSDTTRLPGMWARTQTTGLDSAKDDKLRAVLLSFQVINGKAYYTLQVTNLQSCQMILRWDWENLGLDSATPTDTTGGPSQYDVLKANQTKTYILTALLKPGKIKVQAQKSNSTCPNSSTLIINITNTILPIKVADNKADYDEHTKNVTISFKVDEPELFDWILIYKEGVQAALIGTDHTTKNYSIKL